MLSEMRCTQQVQQHQGGSGGLQCCKRYLEQWDFFIFAPAPLQPRHAVCEDPALVAVGEAYTFAALHGWLHIVTLTGLGPSWHSRSCNGCEDAVPSVALLQPHATLSHAVRPVCPAQDCNLVAYSGLALTNGYSQATAVYYSNTFSYSGFAPCNLVVTSFNGGSIYIQAENGPSPGFIVYQQPAPAVAPPPGSLYSFNGITFTECGPSFYQSGPSLAQCTGEYAQYGTWTSNTAFFNVQNGIQVWTVPATGSYRSEPRRCAFQWSAW